MDYKDTHIEIGKLVNKEAKAKEQANELASKLAKDGKEIKKEIGEDKTFSIMDIQAKDIYQFGPRFGRGSEAIYERFNLKEDPEAKKAMPKEKFNDYSGDYLLLPTKEGQKPNNDFVKSNTWKNNQAVQKGNVIYYDMDEAIYADLISVEKQAKLFKKELLKDK
ncbi:ABC transporter substrate-binding protein [Staphylococcus pseudoxylosus]|uniref:ABC transporter substrate-binding protein n=1 Tax=Staphylococcus pseudoxylosus TaxID=2282419 RepID=UPI001FD40C51|nr:ABC transporter substrate-binding protein [Staphylococcus pseudoxylosus]